MFSDMRMSFRNLGRNRKRTALALLGITVAQATLVWLSSFMNGYESLIFEKLTGPMLGHIQIHQTGYREDRDIEKVVTNADSLVDALAGIDHIKHVSQRVYSPILAASQELGHAAMLVGLDYQLETQEHGLLERLSDRGTLPSDGAVIGKDLAQKMHAKEGDTLALIGQAYDGSIASGLYQIKEKISADVEIINSNGIVLPLLAAREMLAMSDSAHELVIRLDDPVNIPEVKFALAKKKELQGLEILDWQELAPQLSAYLDITEIISLIILVLIFLTTMAGIANTMVMATFERKNEFAMLLALGCSPTRLIRNLLAEAIFLGFIGIAIGSIFGGAIVLYEMNHGNLIMQLFDIKGMSFSFEGLDISFDIFPILKWRDLMRSIVAILVTATVATFWPARRILKLEPVEGMRS